MIAKTKIQESLSFSQGVKPTPIPKEEWRSRLKGQHICNSNYSFDVVLLVESNYTLCPATNKIEEQGEESTAVKFLSIKNLIKFLNNTCSAKPEYDYYKLFADAFTELQEEYTKNNKLSPKSLVYLIKLRILAYNEVIAHDRELVKRLKHLLEEEMKNINEEQQQKNQKQKKEKPSPKANKKADRKSKGSIMKLNTLDQKYLQAKAGNLPNFVETSKIPTIYNTDYDEPDPENIYYVLTGIYDPSLISYLQKYNIPILSLIELGLQGVNFNAEEMVEEILDEFEFDRILSMRSFWLSLSQDETDIPHLPKNSCYIKYSIPDPTLQTPTFDDFLILLKNISDFKRLYYNYFTKVRYLDVLETRKPVCLSSMNSYNGFLDEVPNECVSISLILHALLDEVCARVDKWTNEKLENLKKSKKVKPRHHGGPVVQIKSILREYDCSHKKVHPIIKMPKAVEISYGNTLEFMNAHVPINNYIDLVEITLNQLKKTLPLKLFQQIATCNAFDVMFYNYVFSKWSEQLINVSAEELTHCVYAYLFTRGNFCNLKIPTVTCNSTKENKIQECMYGVKKLYNESHKILTIKLNTSFFKSKQSIQSDPLKAIKPAVEDESVNSCDNLSQQYATLAQDLDSTTFIQMINVAFNNYNHFDYKYFAPTDVILIRFHYVNEKCGYSEKNQKYFLRTPLCFRDFCYKSLLQDSEWFLNEEKEYWKQVYVDRENEKQYLLQHPKVDDYFDPKEFIIPGSIKDEMNNKTRVSTGKKLNTPKPDKKRPKGETASLKKSPVKAKVSNFILPQPEENDKEKCNVAVPICQPYDSEKKYAFEIYNLGQNFYPLEFEEILYQSFISVKFTKQQLPKQPLLCTFLVSSQDTNLILHCEQDVLFKQIKPLHFNVNLTNGIVMVFSIPNPPVYHIENRHIVMNKSNTSELNKKNDSQKSVIRRITKSTGSITDPKVNEIKNEVLQYLSVAMKEKLPVFKIISSRLHKYQYVKRVKSKITLPIGNIYKRLYCKPVLYKRLTKNQNTYEGKCIPYSDLVNKERSPIDWKWNCSIPTGLSMETVQAGVPHDFYIRQRYVIERKDLPSIQDEAYRCYLRCGIIMKFLKDGSIKTFSPDKTLSHYKYGYFSSNKHRASKATIKDIRLKRQTNIIPLHAYKKNISDLEKKVRKICKKYKRHLINIADNYRFETSRVESKKIHKIYKLSKKIYTKDSHVIPLINHSVITSEGTHIDVRNNVVYDTFKKYEETRSRDYLLNETVTRRDDGTTWMIDKNGNAITQFPDGSRIKTWYTILNEDLILEEDPEDQKRAVKKSINAEESLTKFCQTVEEYEMNDQVVEVLFNKEPKEQTSNSSFVFVGMNYSFEHPNFATVSYYCWEDSSAEIQMADDIQVTAFAEGTYKLKLINNDIVKINTEDVELFVQTADTMKEDSCFINFGNFNTEKQKAEQAFLSIKESEETVFVINSNGEAINKKNYTPNTSTLEALNSICSDRMFVMKRDLSGMEMIREPIPYNFVHTLIDLKHVMSKKNHANVVVGPTKMKIFQPLKKTYSEHLMMMYDVPILATTKERQCLHKLWKLHDLDINTIIAKRSPLVIFERYISFLPTEIIVEQIAQAVLKCIVEGNENLPNVNLIQDLAQTDDIVIESEVVEEKIPTKKFIPKHLTYKKQLERYKKLINKDIIPRYFETVRGLMFLTVEECSEGAMEGTSTKRDQTTDKKIEKKTQKSEKTKQSMQKEFKKSNTSSFQEKLQKSVKRHESTLSGTYPTKLNIPDRLSIHLKPNAPVHEIILTANGLQIITDKNIDNYYYATRGTSQSRSITNKSFTDKNKERRSVLEKASEPIEVRSNTEINQKFFSSYFGEDVGGYFDSAVKIPSWDDSLCQKACINSYSTTNTLVTIPETKPIDLASCNQATCACSVESIERLAKCCKCKKFYCNCKDTYSAFATCAVQNELKISEAVCILATKIIQTVEKDETKFNLLHSKLENIIKDTANAWVMSEAIINDLIKALKWIIENKIKTKNTIPEKRAITIVQQIEATVSKMKISNRTVTLSIGNLQKMADLVLKLVCNSKNNANIVKEIRKLLGDAQISRLDIIDTLKLAKEKIHLYYEYGLYPDLPIPEIPAESKCCKIAQYVDYLLDNMLEGTCDKCNNRSIVNNISIHNTSPVNRSKESFQKSETVTQESLAKKQPDLTMENNSNDINSFTNKDEQIKQEHYDNLELPSRENPNIIIEPFNYPHQTHENKFGNDDFDVSSVGGYSLVKSCDEIVDLSIPFVHMKNTNNNIHNKAAVNETIIEQPHIHEQPKIHEQPNIHENIENNYILSKIILSEIPIKSKETDIITIMAPEHKQDSYITTTTATLLSPVLLHSTQGSPKDDSAKPMVYDGKIFTK